MRGESAKKSEKLEVIRKLLAKAERAATPEESETYTAKAMELMARHGIDEALLAAAEPGRDVPGGTTIAMTDPYSSAKARLLAWIAAALRCRSVLHTRPGGRVAAVTVFGFASDRERVEMLFTSLLMQATAQLAGQRPAWPDESVAAYRRSWLHGFAAEVHRRLIAAEGRSAAEERTVPAGVPSTELVLADRAAEVDRAFAAAYPHLPTARPARVSGSGLRAGMSAGRRADLGGRRAVGGRRRGAVPAG
ncbi:Protein of unknown function [Pseudonocardia thermophila]|uniref:Uncharacterized protein n=1 Tax=Pseudonocardia thermophila TaxID=1848 RepID=A0A1M6NAN9_PSETH|nr:DUF2786 domain-containing protein [Pseudonocardia thermophila]SHJ92717.1 Protein of unknown function [Pseudonocardia thermophila]